MAVGEDEGGDGGEDEGGEDGETADASGAKEGGGITRGPASSSLILYCYYVYILARQEIKKL